MLKLWQWQTVTAIGEDAIIEAARKSAQSQYEYHKSMTELGPEKIDTLQDAARYFENNELGSVSDKE